MSLPMDRTRLNAAIANQQPSFILASKANIDAHIEAADTIDQLNQKVDSNIASGALTPIPPDFAGRQMFINSNFDIWQRGTSFNLNDVYSADKWIFTSDGSGQAQTVSRQNFVTGQTSVPNEPKHHMRVQVSSPATSQTYNMLVQRIESVRTLASQKITVSYWVKADTTRSVFIRVDQVFGSGGSSTVFGATQSFSIGTTWQRISATFTLPSIAGKTVGTNDNLAVELHFPIGVAYTMDVAQAQFCAGETALPYQPKTFNDEMNDCLRYYYKSFLYGTVPAQNVGNYNGAIAVELPNAAGSNFGYKLRFPVVMRTTPSIVTYNPAAANANWRDATNGVDRAVTVSDISDNSVTLRHTATLGAANSYNAIHIVAVADL